MHVKLKTFITLALVVFLSATGNAQNKPDPNFELYILIGQSNMSGRGPITDDMKSEGNERLYMFTKDEQWVLAKHPVHFEKPNAVAAGPGLMFGIKMAEAYPGKKIGLIPCAVGGTNIDLWQPGGYDTRFKVHPYDDAVKRIKDAMQYGVIKGIIWHQGENNSTEEKSVGYLDKLETLINRLRELTGNPDLPFIAGELGHYRKKYELINTQLAKLPGKVPHTGLATTENLVHKGDTTHFDGSSADELGRRYAVQMLRIQKQAGKK